MPLLLDVACGTGIVTTRLRRSGRTVRGVDRSPGMMAKAADRLPGAVFIGDAAALPVSTGGVDAVLMIWLLHLVSNPEQLIAEAARVLSPTGVLLATVDKNEGPFAAPSDVVEVTAPLRHKHAAQRTDRQDRIVAAAHQHGLRPLAEATFTGRGQGRTPQQWIERIRAGVIPWAASTESDELCRALAALPGQVTPRPDPVYRLIALDLTRDGLR